MKKLLLPDANAGRLFTFLTLASLFFSNFSVQAQCPSPCGPVSFNDGGTITPIANSTQTLSGIGAGTYVNVNVHNGGTYTLDHCGSASNFGTTNTQLSLFNYASGSTCLSYNDNPGGACGNFAQIQWASNITGTIQAQSNRSACLGYNGTSGLLNYRCTGPGDPTVYGNGVWNIYAWNAGDNVGGSGAWTTGYSGYLTTPNLSFATTAFWTTAGSPSDYFGYLGCEVGADNHSWSAKRTNFTCGVYRITVNSHDDLAQVIVNGVTTTLPGATSTPSVVYTGVLNSSSNVEFRVSEGVGSSYADISIDLITTSLNGGTVTADQTLCSPANPAQLNNLTSPSGGAGPAFTGGSYTYDWIYLNNCAGIGTSLGVNSANYDPPAGLTNTRCYTRSVTDACGEISYTPLVNVTVNQPSVAPTGITTATTNICNPTTISLNVQGGTLGTGAQWVWYEGTCGVGGIVGTGPVINVTPAATTTYFVRAEGPTPCATTTSCASITINVSQPSSSPSSITVSPSLICNGSNTTLTINGGSLGTGAQWVWYAGGCASGSPVASGVSNSITVSPTSTTTYFVRAEGPAPCATSTACASATVTVNQPSVAATSIAVTQPIICSGGTTQLTVQGGSLGTGANWVWYANGCGLGNSIGSGPTVTVSPGVNTTYFVRAEGPAPCTNTSCISTTITVGQLSTDPTSITGVTTICNGLSTTLTVLGGSLGTGATWNWYSSSCGGTPQGTGSSITVSPSGNTTYFVRAEGGCNITNCTFTNVIVQDTSIPASSILGPTAICNGSSTNLTVNGGFLGNSANWRWYSGSCGGTLEGSGALLSVSPTTTTTYYVRAQGLCNTTICTPYTLTVNPLPNGNISGTTSICNGASAVLTFNFIIGTGPFNVTYTDGTNTYSKNGVNTGDTIQVAPTATSTYAFTSITDANTCVKSSGFAGAATVTVTPLPDINSVAPTNVLCNGGSTGSITVNASNGTPPLFYSIDNGLNFQPANLFTGLTIGNYNVVVKDNQTCSRTYLLNPVIITEPTAVTQTSTPTDASCANVFDGKIDVVASGGVPPYSYSLNGGPGQNGSSFNGLSAGSYVTYVYDFNGCLDTAHVIIGNSYTIISAIDSQTNVSCYGGNNGAVAVILSGGTPTFSYSINGTIFQPSPNFTGLTAASYIVTLRDSKGCTDFLPVTISQPAQLAINVDSVQSVLCNGTPTGAVFITASGGTSPYSYLWSNGDTLQDADSLSSGTYSVTVTDSKGCFTFASATITQPVPLFVSIASFHDLKCYNDSSGTIDVTVNGGVPTYSYLWSNGATTEDISGLKANTYTLTVTDNNGCAKMVSQLISEPVQLTSSINPVHITCHGYSNGNIDLTVNGGTSPYSYFWNTGSTAEDIANVPSGNYNVLITDAKGCATSNSVSISQPNALSITSSVVNVLCNGDNSGAIDLTVTGGTGSYIFTWSNLSNTEDVSSLIAGTYSVTVTDANSCTATASFVVTQPSQLLTLSLTSVDVTCNGLSTGSINLNVSGGTSPFLFNWTNGATTEDLSALSAGNYSVTVTDASGCSSVSSATINEPALLSASISATNVSCFGSSDGAADLTVAGGNSGYTYLWSNFATTEDISGLAAGNYVAIVNDSKGCQVITSIIIIQPSQIVVTGNVGNLSCNGAADGTIDLTVNGGTTGYTYLWSNGSTSQDQNGLSAGVYNVTVFDVNLCTATSTFTITQPAVLGITSVTTNVNCNGADNGAINITVSGGSAPYTYSWSGGETTEDVSGLSGGLYSVIVTDANFCTIFSSFTISEPSAITSSISATDVTCYGVANGAADLTVNGGVTPYSYLWSTFQNSEDLSNLSGGTYYVIIKDANGCEKRDSVIISEPAAITISVTPTNVLCNGGSTGAIDVSVNGGTPQISYAWSNSASSEDLTSLSAGTYSVTITDSNSCSASSSVTITQPTALVFNATTSNVGCAGGANGNVDITVQGGIFPYTYLWSNGATTEDVNGLSGGTYTVTITDANGCTLTPSFTISEPSAIISFITGTDVTCYQAGNGEADLSVSGGTAPYSYLWSNFAGTQDLANLTGGLYFVIIKDANGCEKRDSIVIDEPAAITIAVNSTNILCNGANTGAIDITVNGGTPSIVYSWSNSAVTEDVSGLVAGSYSVTITDGNSCTASASATLSEPTALVLNATTSSVGCLGGANGSIDITVQGGIFPYSFVWSNGATTEDINGLSGGTYTVTITDDNGCTLTGNYTITEPTSLTSSILAGNVNCHGAGNGSADLTVSGGTSPYSYLWSNFAGTQDLNGISGGNYIVIITDANGCTRRDSVFIQEPAAILLTTNTSNVLCNGSSTGSVDLTVTGGTGSFTYLWSNGSVLQDLSGLQVGTYTVTATDANGCTASVSVTITQPVALTLSGTVTDVLCNGANNGIINSTVSGGVSPYLFAWSNSSTLEDLSGIAAGNYTVTVTDANACTVSQTFTVIQPSVITSSISGTNVTCNGASNGSADLTVTGGVSPYTYIWNLFQNTQDLSNISGGTYFVIITDANGCTKRDSVIITEPSALILSISTTNILCNGSNNGSVDLSVTGGTGGYTYTWSNNTSAQDLTGVAAGTYTVTVLDANSCSATINATVIQPVQLIVTGNAENVACSGGNTGSVNISVSGGASPYNFSWSNSAITEDVYNLTAGTYSVTVSDQNGCSATALFTLTSPSGISASATKVDVSCQGANNGSADLTVTGGTQPYSFLWSNFQGSEDIANLDGGIYYVLITDANGCTFRDSVIIDEPSPLILSTVVTNISCFNANDGVVDLTVVGGSLPYSFNWSNSAVTEDLNSLPGGGYVVTVTDNHNCTASTSVIVINPSAITANSITHNTLCFGDANGSIDLIPTGGTPNFSFAWSNGAFSEDINSLTAGIYVVTITDSRGCEKLDSITITEPGALFTSGFIKNVTCNADADGCVDITAYGGTLPYAFDWSTGQSTEDICSLNGGNYFVSVTDANGCQAASLYVVAEPAVLTADVIGSNVSCFGGNNGSLTILPAGGTLPYEYLWDDFVTDSTRSSVTAGLHIVLLTDSNGCHVFDSINITQPAELMIAGLVTNANCYGVNSGSIDVSVTGGTAPYTYIWTNGTTTEDLDSVVAGVYTLTVTDTNGCVKTAPFTITQPTQIYLSLITSKPSCHGSTNGSVSVIATQGIPPYTYQWNTLPVQTTPTAEDLRAGTYSVTVSDANGCTSTVSQVLNQPDSIIVSTTSSGAKCFGTASGQVVVSVTGGIAPYVYELNGTAQATDTFRGLLPGNYLVVVTDMNGCDGRSQFTIGSPSQISVDLGVTQQVILTGMQTQLVANATSTLPIVGYSWSPDTLFDFSICGDPANCSNPYAAPRTTTIFTVTAYNSDSCYASDTITVYVNNEPSAFIPTAFTPNGDDMNDRFEFDILGATNLEVNIYTRWGERVYFNPSQTNGITKTDGWDGTVHGKPAPDDTYVYLIRITYFDGVRKDLNGTVTIMR
ncbi:MAG: gliding motility-associated C-terminal domain-containing protein [Chitinophagales bacterium]